MQQQLTIQDFALCLGAPCQYTENGIGKKVVGVVEAIDLPNGVRINGIWYNIAFVKPMLRPLSGLCEDEAREIFKIMTGENYIGPDHFSPNDPEPNQCLIHWWNDRDEWNCPRRIQVLGLPKVWRYLLAHHFDLFNWIDSSLALRLPSGTITDTQTR